MELDLFIATSAQLLVSRNRHAGEWGNGISQKDYDSRESLLNRSGLGKGITCWVLAPKSDPTTLDFFCSCEVYRRPVLIKLLDKPVYQDVSYSIASVFTPPEHRKFGHCRTMMNLLHTKIGRVTNSDQGNIDREIRAERSRADAERAKLSFLYSDVGTFYEKCGWHIHTPTETKWLVAESTLIPINPSLRLLSTVDLVGLSVIDAAMMRTELANLKAPIAFAVEPTGEEYIWLEARANFYADRIPVPRPTVWGAEMGERGSATWSFIIFSLDYFKKTLKIVRTRCPIASDYASLLNFALTEAKHHHMEQVLAWIVDPTWIATVEGKLKGETYQRSDSLSAVAWYGNEVNVQGGANVEWMANEYYAWV